MSYGAFSFLSGIAEASSLGCPHNAFILLRPRNRLPLPISRSVITTFPECPRSTPAPVTFSAVACNSAPCAAFIWTQDPVWVGHRLVVIEHDQPSRSVLPPAFRASIDQPLWRPRAEGAWRRARFILPCVSRKPAGPRSGLPCLLRRVSRFSSAGSARAPGGPFHQALAARDR